LRFLQGFSLRRTKISDQILMWLVSPIIFPFITSILFGLIFGLMNAHLSQEELLQSFVQLEGVMTFIAFAGGLVLSVIIIYAKKIPLMNRKRLTRNEWTILPGLTGEDWKFLAWYVPVGYVLFNIGGSVLEYIVGDGQLVNQEAIEAMATDTPIWMLFITIVIAAPLVEEWLFRGIIFFRKEHNDVSWLTLIITSVLFGLVHVPTSIVAVYTYVGMGLLFGYAAKRTRSVEAAIFFHFINNFIGFLVLISL
jgi:membrane protease YdiL (CAAX protease family)